MSTIRSLARPSISRATEGALCSSMSDTVGLSTGFPGVPSCSDLSALSLLTRFPGPSFLLLRSVPFSSHSDAANDSL